MTAAAAGTGALALPGLLLRLAGPLQSWGEHSHFSDRDTLAFPSRSGITGMLAAALGRPRHAPLDEFASLSITVRVDRAGNRLRDFHTVGGGLSGAQTVVTADGGRRTGDTTTLTSTRWYLQDAVFTVALTLTDRSTPPPTWATALSNPCWPLYLGRRSCPPAGPVLLGTSTDALHDLTHLPLATRADQYGQSSGAKQAAVPVLFLSDQPLPFGNPGPGEDQGQGAQPHSTVLDVPLDFTPGHRRYRTRPLYRRTLALPASLQKGYGTQQLQALAAYASPSYTPAHEGSPAR
ncbi:type I-E CRISPR-associated protein Cas5/CasD [Streptomyces sp. NRRL F-5630]|uniref:type I-E CRISPR-associated protein Cas5/CasD n=1 Tax=Streptomyces sp. NRRL F-5630 TaxID=1463864 RepID=UPI0004C8D43A|nr:type I-E CRISPR-associated protein Cas5/CasD [Streptomyces sp. NRRL F-5630]